MNDLPAMMEEQLGAEVQPGVMCRSCVNFILPRTDADAGRSVGLVFSV